MTKLRIAVIGDATSPTPTDGGHGLGRATWLVAEGLVAAGHDVTLFAVEGSRFSGHMVLIDKVGHHYETHLAHEAYKRRHQFDVYLDNSHGHHLSRMWPLLPVVNVYHDKWQPPAGNPVVCSRDQIRQMNEVHKTDRFSSARIIHHQLEPSEFVPSYRPDFPPYVMFLGITREYKQPILAIEAAAAAGYPLKMVGTVHFDYQTIFSGSENVRLYGPVGPSERNELLRGATALLQLGPHESFGLSTVEAMLCGAPVVAVNSGGSLDIVKPGVSGVFANSDYRSIADGIHKAARLDRRQVRRYAEDCFGHPQVQVEQTERALLDVYEGERW